MSDTKLILQAEVIKRIQEAVKELDIDLMQEVLTDMARMNISHNSDINEPQQKLHAAKVKQFELYVNAAENLEEIAELQIKLEIQKL